MVVFDFMKFVYVSYSYCMVQKFVVDVLIFEFELVVEVNMICYFDIEDIWFVYDYVLFDQGENFVFFGGCDWDLFQLMLFRMIIDVCEILLIFKDNLVGYYCEFVEYFIFEDWWGCWFGWWIVEEYLYVIVLCEYLVVIWEVDLVVNEDV